MPTFRIITTAARSRMPCGPLGLRELGDAGPWPEARPAASRLRRMASRSRAEADSQYPFRDPSDSLRRRRPFKQPGRFYKPKTLRKCLGDAAGEAPVYSGEGGRS
jgi:hypothetical protein